MKHRNILRAWPQNISVLAFGLLAAAPAAMAQSAGADQAEIDALRARVEALEKAGTSSPLKFSLQNGTSIELYGYIKGDLIYDGDFNLGAAAGGLAAIGLPGGPAAGTFTQGHARQSRFGLNIDGGDFKARIEGDFFGAGNAFRLRHAYGEYKGLLVGQTWTNFMSLFNYPGTLDFQGPAGMNFARVAQVRYTYESGTGLALSGSIEEDKSGTANAPSITARAQYGFGIGTVGASAIFRDIAVAGVDVDSWAVSIGASVSPWQGGTIMANFSTGDANSDLLVFGLAGAAQLDALGEISADGITVGISQEVGDKLVLSAAYGMTELDRAVGAGTQKIETIHVTAIYNVTKKVSFGLEYLTGTRTQGNGVEFDADRIQFSGQFRF